MEDKAFKWLDGILIGLVFLIIISYFFLSYLFSNFTYEPKPDPKRIFTEHQGEFNELVTREKNIMPHYDESFTTPFLEIPSNYNVKEHIAIMAKEDQKDKAIVWFMIKGVPVIVRWFIYYNESDEVSDLVAGGKVSSWKKLDDNWFFVITN